MLKLVFEWCRIHIKTVLAQHYSLVVFYPILLWFTYALFIQATPVQVGPGPPKSAQVNPNLQVLPSSPRSSQESSDFLQFCGFPGFPGRTWVLFSAFLWVSGISWENLGVIFCVFVGFRDFLGEPGCYFLRFCGFPGFPGRTWVLFSAFLWVSGISWENLGVIFCVFVGFRDFLGEPGCYFLRFCGFPGFPGRTWVLFSAFLLVSGISWDFLGVIFCAFVGFPGFPGRTWVETVGDGPGRAARVSSGKSGWRVARVLTRSF